MCPRGLRSELEHALIPEVCFAILNGGFRAARQVGEGPTPEVTLNVRKFTSAAKQELERSVVVPMSPKTPHQGVSTREGRSICSSVL